MYWNDARTVCQENGGDLAVIRSYQENQFIWDDIINKYSTRKDNEAWIGIFAKSDKKFHWVDQTLVQQDQFTSWNKDQPGSAEVGKCGKIVEDEK